MKAEKLRIETKNIASTHTHTRTQTRTFAKEKHTNFIDMRQG